jgi:hypothetical protein
MKNHGYQITSKSFHRSALGTKLIPPGELRPAIHINTSNLITSLLIYKPFYLPALNVMRFLVLLNLWIRGPTDVQGPCELMQTEPE